MVKGLNFKAGFRGLSSKTRGYRIAFAKHKKNVTKNTKYYSDKIYMILNENVPKDTGTLADSIKKIPLNRNRIQVKLEPHVPHWVFNEMGLKKPKWVVVDTKPDLISWLERHPQVKTRTMFIEDLGVDVEILLIGGKNNRLGKQNKFVQPARDFIKNFHKLTANLMAESLRKDLPTR